MAIGCGAKCSKVMLIVFNIIFWLSGCAILAIGIWLRVDPNMVSLQKVVALDPNDTTLETAAYVLIGVGAFVFLVGFCGCCGALRESKFMLGVYMACLVIVMAAELAAGILVAVYKPQVEEKLKEVLLKQVQNNYYNTSAIQVGMDWFQLKFECCGAVGYSDYMNSKYHNDTKKMGNTFPGPPSCCKVKDPKNVDYASPVFTDLTKCMAGNSDFYNAGGCYESVKGWVGDNLPIVIGVGVGIACLELFGFIFACCLCRNVGEED